MDILEARAAVFERTGGAEVIELKTVAVPPPGPGELRIRVRAIGLNRSEAMFREGWHPTKPALPSRIGYEAAGEVESVGEGVTGFAPGDRVATLPVMTINACGAWGEMLTVPAELAVHSPPELSDKETAALWSSYLTAYGMLMDLVTIRPGDWVLVTAASSGLGAPIFQMLKALGARTIATTRGRGKVAAIREMGADHVIATDEESLVASVEAITGGAGVRFAFDPIAGPIVAELAEACAPYGTIVLYGVLDFTPAPLPVMPLIGKNLTLAGYAMLLEDQPDRNARALAHIRQGVTSGVYKPLIGKTFTLDAIGEAAAYLDSMAQVGKVVVTVDQPAE